MKNQDIIKENGKERVISIIRIVAVIVLLAIAVSSVFWMRGCSPPPEYSQIKDRFEQLVRDSHKVNVIVFGEGLPTYERVNDPSLDVNIVATDETYTENGGEKKEISLSYYRTLDESAEIYAFRYTNFDKYAYAFVSEGEMTVEQLQARFPAIEGASVPSGLLKPVKTLDAGKETERKVWYYRTLDKENEIYAFRNSETGAFSYVFVSQNEMSVEELAARFPAIEGVSAPSGKEFYTKIYSDEKNVSYLIPYAETQYGFYREIYVSEDGKKTAYLVPYEEPRAEFYYPANISSDYDVVRDDSGYHNISQIKALFQTVYSRSYANSLYGSIFDGMASANKVSKARYIEVLANGRDALAQLSKWEPFFTEQRVYLFETAEIDKWSSNSTNVTVKVKTYLPSNPDDIVEIEVNLVLQDGEWFLDSPTF